MIKAIITDFADVVGLKGSSFTGNLSPDKHLWHLAGLGQFSEDKMFQLIANHHKINKEQAMQIKINERVLNKPLMQLLSKYKSDYKIGLIHNGLNTLLVRWTAMWNLEKTFDVIVNSSVEKVKKPDSKIYLIACSKLNVKPSEAIFIDDNPNYVAGAAKLGMHGIIYENIGSLKKNLERITK